MAKRTITLDLLAKNKTSAAFKSAGRDAQGLSRVMAGAGAAISAGLAVAGAAAVSFGVQSVRAFAEAEQAQNRLAFALEKFPALADTNIKALQRLNSALALKTRFDDDAIASGQAVLAQFGLTGDQLRRLTPLLLDYAGATGKDLTTSAEDLGRALLGQGRALRVLGIDFSDAGSVAANFDQLMGQLSEKVGGFAERDAETAAGKLDILTNRFGEVQEAVGAALMPALDKLLDWIEGDGLRALEDLAAWFANDGVDALTGFIDKVSELANDGKLVPAIVTGLGAITTAQLTLNAAMAANPVGIIIASIAALGTWFYWLANNFDQAQNWMFDAADNTLIFLGTVARGFVSLTEGAINAIGSIINAIYAPMNTILRLLSLPEIRFPRVAFDTSGITRITNQSIGNIAARNGANVGSGGGGAGFRAMAEGGIVRATPGGIPAVVGEGLYDEAVVPLSPRNLSMLGGGPDIHVHLHGVISSDKTQMMKFIYRGLQDAQKLGDIPRGALA